MTTQEDMLTINEAADFLTTTRPTLYRWLRQGKVKGIKMGRQWRFKKEDLSKFLQGRSDEIDLPMDISPFLNELASQIKKPSKYPKEPLKEAFTLMVELMIEQRAESIHLGSFLAAVGPERVCSLRLRVDGMLRQVTRLDSRLLKSLIDYWKKMAGCDGRERSVPQDGRILLESDSENKPTETIDLRVSFLPSLLGETLTVRRVNFGRSSLDQFEILQNDRDRIRRCLAGRSRLFVVSGLAGSALESVICAGLSEITGPDKRTITVEGLAWQVIPWSTPVSLSSMGESRSYAVAVRTVLRSDPDIVGLRKIADTDTLNAALEATVKGALVVAGVNARSALDTLRQLQNLTENVTSLLQALELVFCQTLVRKLCLHCREQVPEAERESLKEQYCDLYPSPSSPYRAVGCSHCNGVGYRGRLLVGETITLSRSFADLIRIGAPQASLAKEARREGTVFRETQLAELVKQGVTSLEEAGRVLN